MFSVSSKSHPNTFFLQECILLNWLDENYNRWYYNSLLHKKVLSDELSNISGQTERLVNNFENDLSDGLVLTAVTLKYCQYLEDDYFFDVFYRPKTYEQVC